MQSGTSVLLSLLEVTVSEELHRLALLVIDQLDKIGDAPGHSHSVPGIWDRDNGQLAGLPCKWCATWKAFKLAARTPDLAAPAGGDREPG